MGAKLKTGDTRRDLSHHLDVQRNLQELLKQKHAAERQPLPTSASEPVGTPHGLTVLEQIIERPRQLVAVEDALGEMSSLAGESAELGGGALASELLATDIFARGVGEAEALERERVRKLAERSMRDIESNVELLLGQGRDFFGTDSFFKKEEHRRLFGGPLSEQRVKDMLSVVEAEGAEAKLHSVGKQHSRKL